MIPVVLLRHVLFYVEEVLRSNVNELISLENTLYTCFKLALLTTTLNE
jgi:hypothetical protein